jgi:signal transduction histidine kinase
MGENAVICVARDISERKNNEELKRRIDENIQLVNETLEYDKIRTEYFANISHEIKTPLNVILGTLQLFEFIINDQTANEGSDRLKKYTSIMKQNCFRLLRMFENLIYITEIDSGFIDMNYQNHELVKIVEQLLSVSGGFVERKGAHLKVDMYSSGIKLACDADKIRRILLNLLSNAVKFTEKGDEICVSLHKDKDSAYISVKDTGIGIQENMKGIIFERFRQVDKSFTRRCEGSGIGLYLAKSLAEMHGGSIEVRSEYGKGSEFIVKLPLYLIDEDEIAATAEETKNTYMDMVSIEFSDVY